MADDIVLNPGVGGNTVRTTDIGGKHTPHQKIVYGGTGVATEVTDASPLPVNQNAKLKNTYIIPINRLINTALAANTTRQQISIEHAASATKTLRLKKIHLGALNTTAVAGDLRVLIDYGIAASSGGTLLTAQPTQAGIIACEATIKTLPTIVAATNKFAAFVGSSVATANTSIIGQTVYEWFGGSEEIPFLLRAGFLESLVIGIQSFGANIYHLTGYIILTEE